MISAATNTTFNNTFIIILDNDIVEFLHNKQAEWSLLFNDGYKILSKDLQYTL